MVLLANKKAGFAYEILEKFEAGLELLGTEAKALRGHKGSLESSYVTPLSGEVFLLGAHIPPHQPGNAALEFDPYRSRKLILHKKEIAEISSRMKEKGLTLVVTMVYTKGKRIKAEVAVVRGKKTFDKRETIKKRDLDREMRRNFSSG